MPETPEQKARREIDADLAAAGWIVQDRDDLDLTAGRGIAVREFPMKPGFGFADYLLYLDRKAIGAVEAKPEGTLTGVEAQSAKYAAGLPDNLPAHRAPAAVPVRIERLGDLLHQRPRSRAAQPAGVQFPAPRDAGGVGGAAGAASRPAQGAAGTRRGAAVEGAGAGDPQSRSTRSAEADPRALIQMATGSGKTFTAVNVAYRLLKFAERQAHPVPGGPRQPRQADRGRVRQLRAARRPAQVPDALHRPAAQDQLDQSRRQGRHHHHPAALLDAEGRGRVRRRQRGGVRLSTRPSRGRASRRTWSTTPASRPSSSTSSSSTSATARSTSCGARCCSTSTPSSSASPPRRPARPSASSTRTSSCSTATTRPSPTASTSISTSTASAPASPSRARPSSPATPASTWTSATSSPAPSGWSCSIRTSPTPPTNSTATSSPRARSAPCSSSSATRCCPTPSPAATRCPRR